MTFDDPFERDRRASLRAGDAEREAAAGELRRHHGDGRLTDDELEQRIAAAYRARTTGELHRLLADLPRADRAVDPRRSGWAAARAGRPPLLLLALGAVALLSLLGALAGGPPHGAYGYHHPPVIIPLLVAFVVWRLIVRRRRTSA
jgi:hypothetical protein